MMVNLIFLNPTNFLINFNILDRPASLKLILKVNGTPEYGSSDSPYNVHVPEPSTSSLLESHSEYTGEKHKKSKKKKKKKDREKKHKHHKKDRHNRHSQSSAMEESMMGDEDNSQTLAGSPQMYYASMSTTAAISSHPVTKPMIPLDPMPQYHTLQNVLSVPSSIDLKPETPFAHQDSPMTPSSMDSSASREPRTCVLKLKQSRSPLAKLLEHALKLLEKRDPHQFFAWPVTDDIAPGYSSIISKPMDFSTIRQKLEDNEYHTLIEFTGDFKLMCDNAIKYNHQETVYNKAARKLLQAGMKLLLPENLSRGSSAAFIKDLSIRELGFDPSIKMEHHDEAYNDSADESTNFDTSDPMGQEERERREKLRAELDPKTPFEPFVDNLTADEILAQVKQSHARLNKRKAHSMGFLRTRNDGTTSLNIIVPCEDGIPEKTKKLGELTGKLEKGTGLLQSFREDRRNQVKLPKSLNYSSFSSFAPTFDTRFSNVSKEEADLMLNTYGDDNGVNYASSIGRFTKDSAYGNTLASRLLNLLTNGDHDKVMEVMMESEQVKTAQKQVDEMLPDYKKETKSLGNVAIDFDELKSLKEIGIETDFLSVFENAPKEGIQSKLNTTSSLIENLHKVQNDRLSASIPPHLSLVQKPNKKEIELADQITSNLTNIAKSLKPGAIARSSGIRKALGMSHLGEHKDTMIDATPMDLESSGHFDHELRELLGTDENIL